MVKNKKIILIIIVGVIALALNIFIIIQSCLDGPKSSESSGMVVNILKNIINTFVHDAINDSNINEFSHVIRKLVGHFGLFLLSGIMTSWFIYLLKDHTFIFRKYFWTIFTLGHGLILATLTECIQLIVPYRSGEILDILIDYSGYITGFLILFLITFIIFKIRQKKIKEA